VSPRSELRHAAHRDDLQRLRCASRPRVSGRSAAERAAFLHQRGVAREGEIAGAPNEREACMKYRGSCHCGRVAFEVEGTLESALACNCSICQRKGSLLWFVPRTSLRLTTPEANLRSYT